jgi:type IV pilus assembly protein PilO
MTQTRRWSLLTAVTVVLLLLAGWFLLVAPQRSEATELRDSAQAQDDANAALRTRIEVLAAQSEDLPEQQARLAELGITIPSDPALPALIRDLTEAAEVSGVELVSLAPALPTLLPGAAPLAPTAAPVPDADAAGEEAEGEDADGEATEGAGEAAAGSDPAAPGAAAVPAAPVDPLYMVPAAIEVTGSYYQIEQFLNKIEDLRRAFLVTGFTLSGDAGAEGETAEETTEETTLRLTLNGRVFVASSAQLEEAVPPGTETDATDPATDTATDAATDGATDPATDAATDTATDPATDTATDPATDAGVFGEGATTPTDGATGDADTN